MTNAQVSAIILTKTSEQYYELMFDDPATPGFISLPKYYYGNKADLLLFAERLSNLYEDDETAAAIRAYFNGDMEASHFVAYQKVRVLTPVQVRPAPSVSVGAGEWTHYNAWASPSTIHCSAVEATRILVDAEQGQYYCVRARIDHPVFRNDEIPAPTNEIPVYDPQWLHGNDANLIVTQFPDGRFAVRNLLYVRENETNRGDGRFAKSYPFADLTGIIDDILGNG